MKKYFRLLLILIFLFLLTGCGISIGISGNSVVKPQPKKSIIYGKFVSIPTGAYLAVNLFDKTNNKIISLVIRPVSFGWETEKLFVYEIDPGEYDLYSYEEGYYKRNTQYFWLSKEGLEELKKLNRRLSPDEFKTIGHDKLVVSPNQTIYIGEWRLREFLPAITNNKISNDVEIKNEFKTMELENSTTSIPYLSILNPK